jgi:hypothetical protein
MIFVIFVEGLFLREGVLFFVRPVHPVGGFGIWEKGVLGKGKPRI